MKKETKFRTKLINNLRQAGYYAYHVKDVRDTGIRTLDILACIDGKFYGIECKIIKASKFDVNKVYKTLRTSQVQTIYDILLANGSVLIYVAWYSNEDIKETYTVGHVKAYQVSLSVDNTLTIQETEQCFLPNSISL